MKVNLLYFGQLTDITKNSSQQFDDIKDTESLLSKLYEQFPKLKNIKFTIAVNNNIIEKNTALVDNATVALMPPFSGG
jgi:molybdopterin synthase sulfur carrier subunit